MPRYNEKSEICIYSTVVPTIGALIFCTRIIQDTKK